MPRASVVIPAHNEAAIIGELLGSLTRERAEELEIIVVANGCSDDTAAVARGFAGVHVIDTPTPGKHNALNLGDDAATVFPRLYVDADVLVTRDDVDRLIEALEQPGVMAAAPLPELDFAGCNRIVRWFYNVDLVMPSQQTGIGGSGVYGLSEAGRARFDRFPNLTADDCFVRRLFKEDERVAVRGAKSIVRVPKNVAGLLAIKTRVHYGNYELAQKHPELLVNRGARNGPKLARLALNPLWLPAVLTYGYVKVLARSRARRRMREQRSDHVWERDDSTRTGQPAVA